MSKDDEQKRLADSIFPRRRSYGAATPKPKVFQPWHKVRKQVVRERQWCDALQELLSRINLDGRPLRYIGLPGSELLDLRLIHQVVCSANNIRLKFLGFNTAAAEASSEQIELEISLDEVRRLQQVDAASSVLPDDFRALSTRESTAFYHAKELGPFDVVNIDLCDGFGFEQPGTEDETYYNAIQNIIHLQCSNGTPWLMFLTTRVGSEYINPTTVNRLVGLLEGNLADCKEFREASSAAIQISDKSHIRAALRTPGGFYSVYAAGLCKWLVSLGLSASPQWVASVKSVASYKVRETNPTDDLLSAVFMFEPYVQAPHDRAGLAVEQERMTRPTECAIASRAVTELARLFDIDEFLRGNAVEAAGFVDRAATLMGQARYDPESYRVWARKKI